MTVCNASLAFSKYSVCDDSLVLVVCKTDLLKCEEIIKLTEYIQKTFKFIISILKSELCDHSEGYKLSMKRSKLRGQKVWEITMTAVSSASRPERVVIDIAEEDYTPMCLRARNDGNWTRFAIYEYAVKQNFSDEDFRFKQADYPTAEVVDLR